MSFTNRSARSHRSTKVPNAKLRPSTSSNNLERRNQIQREREAQEEDDSHFRSLQSHADEEEMDAITFEKQVILNKKPLTDVSLCFTQVGDLKPTLQQYATSLGAEWNPSLMEFTTHLVAMSPGSEKYIVALRHGIQLVKPEWLTEIRQNWIDDSPFDLQQMTEKHQLKPFSGFNICLTGFNSQQELSRISSLVQSLGGNYLTEFDLNGGITHLICSNSIFSLKDGQGTIDFSKSSCMTTIESWKRKFRKKLEITREKDSRLEIRSSFEIKCLWQNWVEDCAEIGAYIPEKDYLSTERSPPTLRSRQKSMSPIKFLLSEREKSLIEKEKKEKSKKSETETIVGSNDDESGMKSKAGISRKSDLKGKGREEEERGQKAKGLGMLDSIISSKNFNSEPMNEEKTSILNLSRTSSFAPIASSSSSTSSSNVHGSMMDRKGKGKATLIDEEKTLVEASATPDDRLTSSTSTIRKIDSNLLIIGGTKDVEVNAMEGEEVERDDDEEEEVKNLFRGLVMAVDSSHGERADKLIKFLKQQGAKVISQEELKSGNFSESLDYYVLPLRPAFNVSELNLSKKVNLVTHLWINKCLHFKKLVSSEPSKKNCGLKPCLINSNDLKTSISKKELEEISISFTSMSDSGIESSEAKSVIDSLGLDFNESVKRNKTTHLIRGNSGKINFHKENICKKWGIEIVDLDFLNNALRFGEFNPGINPKFKEERIQSSLKSSNGGNVVSGGSSNLNRLNSKNQSQNLISSDSNSTSSFVRESSISNPETNDGLLRRSNSKNEELKSVDEREGERNEDLTSRNRNESISRKGKRKADDDDDDNDIDNDEQNKAKVDGKEVSSTDSNPQDRLSTPPTEVISPIIPVSDGATQAVADTVDEVMAMLNNRAISPTGKNRRRAPPNRSGRLRNQGNNRSSNLTTPKLNSTSSPKTSSGLSTNSKNDETKEVDIEALLLAHRNAEALKIANNESFFNQLNQDEQSLLKKSEKEKEESLRIIYNNPQSEKERKKLFNLMKKGENEAAALKKRKFNQEESLSLVGNEKNDNNNGGESLKSSHTRNSSDRSSITVDDESRPSSPTSAKAGPSKRINARKQPGSRH